MLGLRDRSSPDGVQPRMDDDERAAIRAQGLDPDDPDVRAALDLVRWELGLLGSGELPDGLGGRLPEP